MNQNSRTTTRHRVCITEMRTTYVNMTDAELADAGIPAEGLRNLFTDEATGALVLEQIQISEVTVLSGKILPWKLRKPA